MHADLKDAIERRNIVLVVGTGVSAGSTANADSATWLGLINSGIQAVLARGAEVPDGWQSMVEMTLTFGRENGHVQSFLSVAEMVREQFDRIGDAAYQKWLNETVGSLAVEDDTLPNAIRSLPFPILTTNYDTLLENSVRRTESWTNPQGIQRILSGETNSVGHLHGVWNDANSTIFSATDYFELIKSPAGQALQQAASSLKSLVYVGFGAGLQDPNFGKLIEWHRERFGASGISHYRLCRESELENLRVEHANDHIVPVSYGAEYADLAPFLRALQPTGAGVQLSDSGIVRDTIADARQAMVDQLRTEAVLAESSIEAAGRSLEELLVPPVLLPVPHSEYLKSQSERDPSKHIDRLEASSEVRDSDLILVVAEEQAGLTTTLKWMAWKASEYLGSAAPVYVHFQSCNNVLKPLPEQVRASAQSCGIVSNKHDPLPPYVLALDDMTPFVPKISDRVIAALADNPAMMTIIGCKQGVEDELVERLKRVGLTPKLRFIGKLHEGDVQSIAQLFSPTNYPEVSSSISEMLRSENLPAYPYTVSLLLSILLRGGSVGGTASKTSILDQYVGLLLGRGDPHDDARFSFDLRARESILSALAERLVERSAGGLDELGTLSVFQEFFDVYGWAESPSELLTSFIDRRVLRRENKHIVFARTSYLHLFAAKGALGNQNFRDRLLEKPIYYGTALGHYAALSRNDATLLESLESELDRLEWDGQRGTPFEAVAVSTYQPTEKIDRSEELISADAPDDEGPNFDQGGDVQDEKEPEANIGKFQEYDDREAPPFPIIEETEVPIALRMYKTLDITSSVLRDSDLVPNLDLKQRLLAKVLEMWGMAISALNLDTTFQEFARSLAEQAEEEMDLTEKEREEFLDEFTRFLPAAFSLGGIGDTLASRKLLTVFEKVTSEPMPPEMLVASIFFMYNVGEQGWPGKMRTVLAEYPSDWIIRYFMLRVIFGAFLNDDVAASDIGDLRELGIDIYAKSTDYRDHREASSHRGELRQTWDRAKVRHKAQNAISGKSPEIAR
jgi:hypothetical protein